MSQYWIKGKFKDQDVWVHSDEHGVPVVDKGYIQVRYSGNSTKIYRGHHKNLNHTATDTPPVRVDMPETLPEATPIQKIAAVDKSKPTPPITPARPGSIVLFTDGACSGNPGPAGLGVLMQDGDSKRELSGYLGIATNNIAELDAIRRGLKMIGDKTRPVDLYTDSNYAIGVLTKGWKAKANTELVEEIRDLLEDFRNIRFHWVRGHMGHDGNERADELARMAIEKRETREFES